MSTNEVVRAQSPGPETVGVWHGDRGIETQKNRFFNKPRYVETSQYTGPGGVEHVRYRNMFHMPVDPNGNSVDLLAAGPDGGYYTNGGCNGSCGNGGCNGSCGNGGCNGGCNGGTCGDGSCPDDCNGCCLGQLHPGGCGYAALRYAATGYPTHVHKFSYHPPEDLKYPPPNVPAAVIQYPYYTVKGPDDFFLN